MLERISFKSKKIELQKMILNQYIFGLFWIRFVECDGNRPLFIGTEQNSGRLKCLADPHLVSLAPSKNFQGRRVLLTCI